MMSKMSGGRQTGTVPKTKHNTRARRENAVNHIPNNLDWHDSYQPQRARKESNTSASRHSDAGEDMYEENPWLGLAPPQHRPDDDELRWANVKSSNLTPERTTSLANVDAFIAANRASMHRQENGPEDREGAVNKEALTRGRIKLKMEQSQRKIEELQQQQAALLSLRNKTIQQVKPVQMEELHQQPGPLMSMRNKAIQQVKPVQQEELERATNIEGRLQNMQEYANIIQVLERDESSNLEEGQSEQQLRKKLNDLIAKKAQVDSILAYIESDNVGDGAPSLSSDDGEGTIFPRGHAGGDSEEMGRRDVTKQDNREQATAAYLHMKELKLEEVKTKLEQLQTLLTRVERLKESRSGARVNGETASHCSEPPMHPQGKNCPSNSVLDKLHAKKFDLEHTMRKAKVNPTGGISQSTAYNQPHLDSWSYTTQGHSQGSFHQNTADYSSDEAEADYDESPVKLGASTLQPYLPPSGLPKARSQSEGVSNGVHSGGKHSAGGTTRSESRPCVMHVETEDRMRQPPFVPHLQDLGSQHNTALALQISQLQLQMEQMQILYQNMLEKQHVNVFSAPHSCSLVPPNGMGFMQCMTPTTQWHQHQLLVNSLNQCCQLIWHQQRELAGLRQALTMLQEEGSMYKCPSAGYGNNLNFDAGLLWTQHSPQTLNNQVPPGNRANNYWDNFRSYSRQNLLSGRNKSNEGCLPEQLHVSRPSPQNENLRPKDNSCDVRGNSTRCRQQPMAHSNGPCTSEQNSRRLHRRFNASNNLKPPDVGDVISLEQSVYSELESVITETQRSPDMLLQLLSQLKTVRSQQQDNTLGNDCELIEPGTPGFARMEHLRNQPPYDHDIPKLETVLEELGRMVQECEVCTPELLQQVVGFVLRAFHFPSQHDVVARLEASLLKFQGARIGQMGDELLCVIANVISAHVPPPILNSPHPTLSSSSMTGCFYDSMEADWSPKCLSTLKTQPLKDYRMRPRGVEDRESALVEQIEEEGAVGGLPLPTSQHSTSQSLTFQVETELAEADQPQHNSTDNAEVFDIDEGILPNMEVLDNQEMPPREENTEQPLQET